MYCCLNISLMPCREEGGFEFKKAILDGLLDIMETIPEVSF